MRMYKLNLNNKSYEIVVKSVTCDDAKVIVNNKEMTVSIDEIKNVPLPALKGSGDMPTPIATPSKGSTAPTTKKVAATPGVVAPIPGLIKALFVKEGDKVTAGQKVLVMEAMKMENVITAMSDGTVTKVLVGDGDNVDQDQLLIEIGD